MAGDPLERYRRLRDFGQTAEPSGAPVEVAGPTAPGEEEGGRFVVQEHHATSLHWDLRLEHGGVLASWAVPKGIPAHPKQNHLAVRTEDHPMEYLEFEGDIAEGNYGAGRMRVWDRGTYTSHKWDDREVLATFHGGRTSGRYALFRTGGKNWMIHRMDPPADPDRELMPAGLRPMRAVPGPLPDDPESWSFQPAWGGLRVLAAVEGGRVGLTDPGGEDVTPRFPELRALGLDLGTTEVILDAELVVSGSDGRPDRDRLETRARARSATVARRLSASSPAVLVVADLVWLEGHPLAPLPYRERRPRLDALGLTGPAWRVNPDHPGEGSALLAAARAQGLPGVVGKRLDAPYRPGEVSPGYVLVSA